MSFGYLGDTSTKIKQHRKNEGILTPQDVIDLEPKNHLGQSLELIESKNLTGTTPSSIAFESIKESEYKIITCNITIYKLVVRTLSECVYHKMVVQVMIVPVIIVAQYKQ